MKELADAERVSFWVLFLIVEDECETDLGFGIWW